MKKWITKKKTPETAIINWDYAYKTSNMKAVSYAYFKTHFLWNAYLVLVIISFIVGFYRSDQIYFASLYSTLLTAVFAIGGHYLFALMAQQTVRQTFITVQNWNLTESSIKKMRSQAKLKSYFAAIMIALFSMLGLAIILIVNFFTNENIFDITFAIVSTLLAYSTNALVLFIFFLTKFQIIFDF